MNSQLKIGIVIPARMASERLPGKPLLDVLGLPMIEHVRRRVIKSNLFDEVYVATCDQVIIDEVEKFGGKGIMELFPGQVERNHPLYFGFGTGLGSGRNECSRQTAGNCRKSGSACRLHVPPEPLYVPGPPGIGGRADSPMGRLRQGFSPAEALGGRASEPCRGNGIQPGHPGRSRACRWKMTSRKLSAKS